MISLVNTLPTLSLPHAEVIKNNCNFNSYSDIAMFWVQNEGDAVISMLDGNMVIFNRDRKADICELREFVNVISCNSVFSDSDTLNLLFGNDFHKVFVMQSNFNFESALKSDALGSREIYALLDTDGLQPPPYEHFAVDFCHRLNHGYLKYFALKDTAVAVGISDGHSVLVNGIASHKKGAGSKALCGLLAQYNNTPAVAVCEEGVMPFYLKNNFNCGYTAGYWRKTP